MPTNVDKDILQNDEPHKGGYEWAVTVKLGQVGQLWQDTFYKKPSVRALATILSAKVLGRECMVFRWKDRKWRHLNTNDFVALCKEEKNGGTNRQD